MYIFNFFYEKFENINILLILYIFLDKSLFVTVIHFILKYYII
jgi:hypothetical protein